MYYKGVLDKIILLKITSRERPTALLKCLDATMKNARNPESIRVLVSLDTNDQTANNILIEQLQAYKANVYFGVSNSKIHAINRDIETFTTLEDWHILVNLSDDQICQQNGWDQIVRETMPNDLDWSLWFYDGLQKAINTMEIVGRKYYERTGVVYHKEYKSFYCDEESTMVAKMLKRQIKDPRLLFYHDHPAGKGNKNLDDLYNRNQVHWNEDKALFNQRWNINFGV